MARPFTQYELLNKKYQKMIECALQNTDSLRGFYTIFAAFQLFNFSSNKTEQCF